MTVVLAIQEGNAGRLNSSIRDQVALRVELPPWEWTDLRAVVQFLSREHNLPEGMFDEPDLRDILRASRGNPRIAMQLADNLWEQHALASV